VFCPGTSIYGKHLRAIVRAESSQTTAVVRRLQENMADVVLVSPHSYFKIFRISEAKNIVHTQERMTAALMGVLILLLLFVASLGIAGITSFSVTERTRQIGVRRALGATTNDILRYFLTESGIVTTLGLILGTGLAVLLNMVVLRIYDSAKLSPAILGACALLLFLVALGAAFPAARRASRISPAIATRNV
jgi:putative ABC transport system permease protein